MSPSGSGDRLGVRATAAGRVNLIGDHVDYMGGPVLPMAIELGTTLEVSIGGDTVHLRSDASPDVEVQGPAVIGLPVTEVDPHLPTWARYVAAVAVTLGARTGISGTVCSTLPSGVGLSSSAALEVAVALALQAADARTPRHPGERVAAGFDDTQARSSGLTGADGSANLVHLARRCQEAEHLATGVPTGIMDQLTILAGQDGQACLIDCATLAIDQVPVPPEVAIWVLHSGQSRTLTGSAYGERRAVAEAAAEQVGPLVGANPTDVEAIGDPVLRRRARHVNSEARRVIEFADALRNGDARAAGRLMSESHRSLRDDYEVSTAALDELVADIESTPGVFGARLTGAGFGGCVVALAEPGVDLNRHRRGSHLCLEVHPCRGTSVELEPLPEPDPLV
ncbi:MAG: galactokinase [Microthrixaceae bacterium]